MVPRAHTSGETYLTRQTACCSLTRGGLSGHHNQLCRARSQPQRAAAARRIFSSRMRSALVTINIAIARSVSSALICGSTVLARYSALHMGPLGAAPAAAPAGGG